MKQFLVLSAIGGAFFIGIALFMMKGSPDRAPGQRMDTGGATAFSPQYQQEKSASPEQTAVHSIPDTYGSNSPPAGSLPMADDNNAPQRPVVTDTFEPLGLKDAFAGDVANEHTIRIFKEVQYRFSSEHDDLRSHYDEIYEYLTAHLDPVKANEVLDLYREFTEYEISLVSKIPVWAETSLDDTASALALLETIHQDRVYFFGEKTADALYGDETRWQMYYLSRQEILNDEDVYGREKKARIDALKQRIWGEGVKVVETKTLLEQYDDMRLIYKKDLIDMSPSEREDALKRFREMGFGRP